MDTEELPPATPELVAAQVLLSAFWRSMKPAQRDRFQRALSQVLTEMEDAPVPLTKRPGMARSRATAVVWLSRTMREVIGRG